MKILMDMNLAARWADMLRRRGIEALHFHIARKMKLDCMQI
jgi:predicted nuclease of predicted toxin-antitoxin system